MTTTGSLTYNVHDTFCRDPAHIIGTHLRTILLYKHSLPQKKTAKYQYVFAVKMHPDTRKLLISNDFAEKTRETDVCSGQNKF